MIESNDLDYKIIRIHYKNECSYVNEVIISMN